MQSSIFLGKPLKVLGLCCALGAPTACTGVVSPNGGASEASGASAGASAGPGVGMAGNTAQTPGGGANGVSGGAAGVGSLPPFSPAPEAMHRLTKTQFQNSVKALLGNVTIGELDSDSYIGGFATVGAGLVVTSANGVQQYQVAIDAALEQVFADSARRSALVGCEPKTPLDAECARAFVARFGRLAWRRPLTPAQIDRYSALAASAASDLSDSYGGLRWTASALLQSPYFLYRSERGVPVAGKPDRNQYTPYELASKLSFYLLNSTPDAALLDAADSGSLATPEGLNAQVERLLATPQGHEAVVNFARELMRLDTLPTLAKDANAYPKFTGTLASAMGAEFLRLWENAAFESDTNALDLFTTQQTFVNKELAALYGLDTSSIGVNGLTPAVFPASQGRSGLLTSAAMMSLRASQLEGSPTLRGRLIRERFQCMTIPDPPPGIVTTLPTTGPGVFTKRQKMVTHEATPTCGACHGLMDPLGFALEHFDAVGAYRETDSGLAIDASGTLEDQPFTSALELGKILAASPATATCLVQNMYVYAVGHAVPASEQATVQALSASFAASGNRLRALITQVVTSDGFNFTSPESP